MQPPGALLSHNPAHISQESVLRGSYFPFIILHGLAAKSCHFSHNLYAKDLQLFGSNHQNKIYPPSVFVQAHVATISPWSATITDLTGQKQFHVSSLVLRKVPAWVPIFLPSQPTSCQNSLHFSLPSLLPAHYTSPTHALSIISLDYCTHLSISSSRILSCSGQA